MGEEITVVTQSLTNRQQIQAQETPCLVVFYGEGIGHRYPIDATMTLGRGDRCELVIDQESVSRRHAKILAPNREGGQGESVLVDLESTNGSFVNDIQVEGQVALRDGDMVRIGQTIFKYLSGGNLEAKYHEEVYRLTNIDGLTGAHNRRCFMQSLEREVTRGRRYKRDLAVALLDLDHFKGINDTYGHLGGDQVLRELAALVMQNLRSQDVFARYGGEEFALMLPEVDPLGARRVCEKIRALVQAHEFTHGDQKISVTLSLGIASLAENPEVVDGASLLEVADEHLYRAKSSGRNRVCA